MNQQKQGNQKEVIVCTAVINETKRYYNPSLAQDLEDILNIPYNHDEGPECDNILCQSTDVNMQELTGYVIDDGQGVYVEKKCGYCGAIFDEGHGDFHDVYQIVDNHVVSIEEEQCSEDNSMQLIRLYDIPEFKNEIPESMKNEIYALFDKLNIVKYDFSNHEFVNAKINRGKWEIIYPKQMYVKFNELNGKVLKITGVRLSTENEIILGAFNHSIHCHFKVIQ